MFRKSLSLVCVVCALFLLSAAQTMSFASTVAHSLDAYVYVGTKTTPKTLYIETGAKGASEVDNNAWMYVTNGSWVFNSEWFDDFKITTVNGITTMTATIEGWINSTQPTLLTYTWTSFRSVNTLKIKMVDYYTGALLYGLDTYKAPYTSQTGFFVVK